jgi:hypothetical protein
MKTAKRFVNLIFAMASVFGIVWVVMQGTAFAYFDTIDGPVVIEAKAALKKGDVTPVLKWVKKTREGEIKAVFKKVLAARSKGPEAQEIADRYFFETLIRLHRAGEGAPFTGLKPAGKIEPSVASADKTIETGSVDAFSKKIGQAAEEAIRERFARLMEAKTHKDESIEAGREYVESYVIYVHFIEGLHNSLTQDVNHAVHVNVKREENRGY